MEACSLVKDRWQLNLRTVNTHHDETKHVLAVSSRFPRTKMKGRKGTAVLSCENSLLRVMRKQGKASSPISLSHWGVRPPQTVFVLRLLCLVTPAVKRVWLSLQSGWAGCQGSPARGLSLGWPSVTPAGQLGFRSSQLFSGAEKNAWFKLTPRSSHFHSIPFRIQIHDQPQISVCLEAKNNMKCIKHAMQKLQLETSTAICPCF